MIVPAFPGSRTSTSTATRRGRAARTSSRELSTKRQTAMKPWGVTVEDIAASTSGLTSRTVGVSSEARSAPTSGCRSSASAVA